MCGGGWTRASRGRTGGVGVGGPNWGLDLEGVRLGGSDWGGRIGDRTWRGSD